ncbi:hypothetical protein ACJQWK_01281 [Exserohilum turcicum]
MASSRVVVVGAPQRPFRWRWRRVACLFRGRGLASLSPLSPAPAHPGLSPGMPSSGLALEKLVSAPTHAPEGGQSGNQAKHQRQALSASGKCKLQGEGTARPPLPLSSPSFLPPILGGR